MDIDILIALQEFRNVTGTVLAPFMDWVTKMSVSAWPFILVMMFYWVCDRKTGRKMFLGQSFAYFMNGLLKLSFCVYRPWLRDARIEPYGDAKVAATGYSFPSGHSMAATASIGNFGVAMRKRNKGIAVASFVFVFLVMFSRLYLGVHTPQDVLVGFAHSMLMIACGYAVESWTSKNPDRNDKILIGAGFALCIAAMVYVLAKDYPLDYVEGGKLLVDPVRMMPDFYEGIGMVSAFVVCNYFERRGFAFDEEIERKDRFIIGAVCTVPVFWWDAHLVNIFVAIGSKCVGKFIWGAGLIVWPMIAVPAIMKKVTRSSWYRKAFLSNKAEACA